MKIQRMMVATAMTMAAATMQAQAPPDADSTEVQAIAEFHPKWSLKNNLLYDATLTPNLGLEVKLNRRNSVQLFYGLNPWEWKETKKLRHWSLMPEWRYWFSRDKGVFDGWFTGVHALVGEYNVAGVPMPFGMMKWLKRNRYEGWAVGGGLTLGHAWRLSNHWRIEAALGVGYIHFNYDKYDKEVCGTFYGNKTYDYVGLTKLALNIGSVFGKTTMMVYVETPTINEYVPNYQYAYIVPKAEPQKTRQLKGQAYLDFVVNTTDIRTAYHNNLAELRKVEATIDTVRRDTNITVTHIDIHGYASPEGTYKNNTRLAEGRANAFYDYVRQLIELPADIFTVGSTPEDWQGLITVLEDSSGQLRSNLGQHSMTYDSLGISKSDIDGLLAIAKSSAEPDAKERQMKSQYPAAWKQMLAEVFPWLRHSDYIIDYTIRPFTVEEAKQILRAKPQQLSLNEMFLVVNTYEPGSQDYNDVFETAVRMYPDDETANLNAALIALGKNDLTAAERYLRKAGEGDEVENARGILATKRGDYEAAEVAFNRSSLSEARHNIEELRLLIQSIRR